MVQTKVHGLIWTMWIVYCSIVFFSPQTGCSKKTALAHHDSHGTGNHGHGSTKKHHHKNEEESESEEEDTTASAPETVGLKGLAGAGISTYKGNKAVPKCLGQEMRMEKIIQVARFCEGETGEGKNETEIAMRRSLCFTACMYKYLGLIGEDLMFTSNIGTFVVDVFPSSAHSLVKKAMRSCAKQSILPLSNSDNCTSYGPVKGCILRNINNICSGDY